MLDSLLIFKNLLLLNFMLLKKCSMFCLHADSFHDTIIVEKYPEYEQSKRNPKKKLFRVRANILPDSIDKFFHGKYRFWLPCAAADTAKAAQREKPFVKRVPCRISLYPECVFSGVSGLIAKLLLNTKKFIVLCHTVRTRKTAGLDLAGIGCYRNLGMVLSSVSPLRWLMTEVYPFDFARLIA